MNRAKSKSGIMLAWSYYTVPAPFLSRSFHILTGGMTRLIVKVQGNQHISMFLNAANKLLLVLIVLLRYRSRKGASTCNTIVKLQLIR